MYITLENTRKKGSLPKVLLHKYDLNRVSLTVENFILKCTREPTLTCWSRMHVFISVKSDTIYFESSRLVAVPHGKVWLGIVEHFLELSVGLQLSLVVIGIVAHPVGGNR